MVATSSEAPTACAGLVPTFGPRSHGYALVRPWKSKTGIQGSAATKFKILIRYYLMHWDSAKIAMVRKLHTQDLFTCSLVHKESQGTRYD
jgi:hypothetical protein